MPRMTTRTPPGHGLSGWCDQAPGHTTRTDVSGWCVLGWTGHGTRTIRHVNHKARTMSGKPTDQLANELASLRSAIAHVEKQLGDAKALVARLEREGALAPSAKAEPYGHLVGPAAFEKWCGLLRDEAGVKFNYEVADTVEARMRAKHPELARAADEWQQQTQG